jgi:hypothetical protein
MSRAQLAVAHFAVAIAMWGEIIHLAIKWSH